jgi:hypothetical protein
MILPDDVALATRCGRFDSPHVIEASCRSRGGDNLAHGPARHLATGPSAGRRRSYSKQPLYPPSAAVGALPKLKLRIEPSPLRHHFAKATVQVRRYLDGTIALFFGPRCIGRFAQDGTR